VGETEVSGEDEIDAKPLIIRAQAPVLCGAGRFILVAYRSEVLRHRAECRGGQNASERPVAGLCA
jgi:hypothetical protein